MPKELHHCVKKVGKGKGKNPWAICNAALKRKKV